MSTRLSGKNSHLRKEKSNRRLLGEFCFTPWIIYKMRKCSIMLMVFFYLTDFIPFCSSLFYDLRETASTGRAFILPYQFPSSCVLLRLVLPKKSRPFEPHKIGGGGLSISLCIIAIHRQIYLSTECFLFISG